MTNNKIYKFELKSPKGNHVIVSYTPKWSFIPELDHRVDHFEYEGIDNSTGYRSKFIYTELDFNPSNKKLIEFIEGQMEKIEGIKYGSSYQKTLI